MDVKSRDIEDTQKQQQQQQQDFHVLAVDDSVIDRKVLERLLRVSSYQVTCVDSGNKALEYLGLVDDLDDSASFPPASSSRQQHGGAKVNLIMTDYCMPGMSGYDLLKRLKGSSWKDVPVVVMSSENVPSRISMCLEEGAEEFLLKPLQLSDMEKLHPHLLKSVECHPCTCKTLSNSDKTALIRPTTTTSNNNSNKRKVLSQEAQERRPKTKEPALRSLQLI